MFESSQYVNKKQNFCEMGDSKGLNMFVKQNCEDFCFTKDISTIKYCLVVVRFYQII